MIRPAHLISQQTELRLFRKAAWGMLLLLLLPATRSFAQIRFSDATFTAQIETDAGGYGASVADYDGDGWDDLFVAVQRGPSALFHNNRDGTFTNVAAAAGIATTGETVVGLWGDVDNDGWPDLFTGQHRGGENKLYLNNGDGTFRATPTASGLDASASIGTAAFGDFDNDGYLDLFLAVDQGPDQLYRNRSDQGSLLFEEVTAAAGVAGLTGSIPMQATWIDYDRDGDLDLFCVHDGQVQSRLLRNDGTLPFIDIAPEASIADIGVGNSMGTAWGDFDGDGWLDAYVTRIKQAGLYRNNTDGTFSEVALNQGAARNGMSWGVVFADFDNDSDEDLFVVNTSGYDGTRTLLYENDQGRFTDISVRANASWYMDANGLAAGDFNNDGLVDVFIPNNNGRNRILYNETETDQNWVKVHLRRAALNPWAIGTRVELQTGTRMLVRVVSGGDSFSSQSSNTLHFGLGEATRIDTLRLYWGNTLTHTFTNLPVKGLHRFTESKPFFCPQGSPCSTVDHVFEAASHSTHFTQGPETPVAFNLEQNYPNPFNPATTIRFTLPSPLTVSLTVTDVLGRNVATVLERPLGAGQHAVSFDARHLPSGLYLYHLQAGAFRQTRSFVVAE